MQKHSNVSHKSPDLPSMISDCLTDDGTDKANVADGDHKNFKKNNTTAPMVSIQKKVPLALRRLKDLGQK